MASILSKKQKKKENYTLKELKSLGCDLLSSRGHINNLPLLLSFISPESPPQFVVESLLSLQSFFTPLLPQLPSSSSSSPASSTKRRRSDEEDDDDSSKTESDEVDGDPEVIFKAWLRSKFDEFVKVLLDVLVSQQSEDTLRDIVLGTLMEFVKLLNAGRFHSSIYHRILNAIIHSAVDADMFLDILNSKYFKYIDVRYFTYISMEKFVKTLEASALSADKTVMENSETENESKDRLVSVSSRLFEWKGELVLAGLESEAKVSGYHADNIAPAIMGGFVLIRSYEPLDLKPLRFPEDKELFFVLVSPEFEAPTKKMRAALPTEIPMVHHVWNSSQAAALVAAVLEGDAAMLGKALSSDKVVEPTRAPLIPGMEAVKKAALEAGAFGCTISGAGPTAVAVVDAAEKGEEIGERMVEAFMRGGNLKAVACVKKLDKIGARLVSSISR
ncbi:hypothetical protein F2Q68_00019238 [Brassica cretica]|uniref:GHMP kinase C-terminal domain-containing protein n=1 Tax=Brassica cretica TaxID=69181 RepID=A0A8S9FUJ4_BRACR|nr:hypothetical protein F2Q68_00019238 [Brassica cretica]